MNNSCENALLSIADPITWCWNGANVSEPGHTGWWEGKYGETIYKVHSPDRDPKDVDASPFDLSWHVTKGTRFDRTDYKVLVSSAEAGKAVCVRHALTQDLSELNALLQETRAATKDAQWFMAQKETAVNHFIMGRFLSKMLKAPTWLNWTPDEKFHTEYQSKGARGIYTLCFDPTHRWMVTLTQNGEATQGPCFVTYHYACLACSYFDYFGEWEFILEEGQGREHKE